MVRPSKRDYLLRIVSASKGINRKKLSEISGINEANLWRAEVGKVISRAVVLKLAEALDIEPDILYYNMGRLPPDIMEFVVKDPLFFKELLEEACAEPWRLTKTQEYINSLKEKQKAVNPAIGKLLNKIRPTE